MEDPCSLGARADKCMASDDEYDADYECDDEEGLDSDGDESDMSDCSSIGEGLSTELRHSATDEVEYDDLNTLRDIRERMEMFDIDGSSGSESDYDVDEPNPLPVLRMYNVDAEERLLGGRREKGEVRRGTRVGVQSYGPGVLLPNNYVQPRSESLRPLKIVGENHTWQKEPERQSRDVPFDLEAPPELLKFSSDASVCDMFLSLWQEPSAVWIQNTNRKGRELSAAKRKEGKKWRWKDLTESEALAFVAALLRFDVNVKPTVKEYWSRDFMTRDEFILEVRVSVGDVWMSFRRFSKIMMATRLYNKRDAMVCGASDKSSPRYDTQHKVRPFFDAANKSFQDHREPGSNIAIDESMSKFTGRCGFLQSMPRKPIKRGIKHYYLCESEDGYVYRFLMHSTQSLPYSAEFGYVLAVCMCLLDGLTGENLRTFLDRNRTVFFDRFYTSIPLAKALLDRSTFLVGTIKLAMKNMPYLKENRDGEEVNLLAPERFPRGSTLFRHDVDGELTLTAWMDSKVVAVLSSYPAVVSEMGTCERRVKGERSKCTLPRPLIAKLFDEKMGGVDLCDQQIAAQRRHKKTYVWFTSMLFRVIDLVCINIYAIKKRADAKLSMREIKTKLAQELWDRAKKTQKWRPRPAWTKAKEEVQKARAVGSHTPHIVRRTDRRVCVWCKKGQGSAYCIECACVLHDRVCWFNYHNTDVK